MGTPKLRFQVRNGLTYCILDARRNRGLPKRATPERLFGFCVSDLCLQFYIRNSLIGRKPAINLHLICASLGSDLEFQNLCGTLTGSGIAEKQNDAELNSVRNRFTTEPQS